MKDDKLNRIVNSIIKAIDERMQKKPRSYYTEAEVLRVDERNGVAYVHIPGGVDETPAKLTIDAKAGDTVQIRVGDGTAVITGNHTAPPTDDKVAEEALQEATTAAKGLQKIDEKIENGDFEAAELSNIVTMYCLSTSNSQFTPAPGYDWTETVPTYTAGLYYWTKTVTTLDDGSTIETDPVFDLTAQAAAEANAIATSTDNHFWHDTSGVYVTKADKNAASGYATRIVSEGIQHTYNGNPLFALSGSALTFYQSDGSTPMATYGSSGTTLYAGGNKAAEFMTGGINLYDPSSTTYPAAQFLSTGAIIGKENTGHITLDSNSLGFYSRSDSKPFAIDFYSSSFNQGKVISSTTSGSEASTTYYAASGVGRVTVYAKGSGGSGHTTVYIEDTGVHILGDVRVGNVGVSSQLYNANIAGTLTAGNIAVGSVSITPSAANTPTSQSVSFGKTFPSAPQVVVTPESTVAGTTLTGWAVTNITTTGFTAWVTRGNTTSTTLHWIAIG